MGSGTKLQSPSTLYYTLHPFYSGSLLLRLTYPALYTAFDSRYHTHTIALLCSYKLFRFSQRQKVISLGSPEA
jgi:hypothetical protein